MDLSWFLFSFNGRINRKPYWIFLVLMVVLLGYSIASGHFAEGVAFLFKPDWGKLTWDTVLTAMGQAFFTLSIGMGAVMAYGAYLPEETSIPGSAAAVAISDTSIALLAGLVIFPLVFGNDLDPGSGPGLIFQTLPTAFAEMPGGRVFGVVFFVLLAFAAVTSLIAIIEPIVRYAEDKWQMRRRNGVLVFGTLAWAIGLLTVFSFNIWADVHPLGHFKAFEGKTAFDLIDFFTANLMMPLGGILMALFVGWLVKPSVLMEDLSFGSRLMANAWLWMIRIVVPLAILWVLYDSLYIGS